MMQDSFAARPPLDQLPGTFQQSPQLGSQGFLGQPFEQPSDGVPLESPVLNSQPSPAFSWRVAPQFSSVVTEDMKNELLKNELQIMNRWLSLVGPQVEILTNANVQLDQKCRRLEAEYSKLAEAALTGTIAMEESVKLSTEAKEDVKTLSTKIQRLKKLEDGASMAPVRMKAATDQITKDLWTSLDEKTTSLQQSVNAMGASLDQRMVTAQQVVQCLIQSHPKLMEICHPQSASFHSVIRPPSNSSPYSDFASLPATSAATLSSPSSLSFNSSSSPMLLSLPSAVPSSSSSSSLSSPVLLPLTSKVGSSSSTCLSSQTSISTRKAKRTATIVATATNNIVASQEKLLLDLIRSLKAKHHGTTSINMEISQFNPQKQRNMSLRDIDLTNTGQLHVLKDCTTVKIMLRPPLMLQAEVVHGKICDLIEGEQTYTLYLYKNHTANYCPYYSLPMLESLTTGAGTVLSFDGVVASLLAPRFMLTTGQEKQQQSVVVNDARRKELMILARDAAEGKEIYTWATDQEKAELDDNINFTQAFLTSQNTTYVYLLTQNLGFKEPVEQVGVFYGDYVFDNNYHPLTKITVKEDKIYYQYGKTLSRALSPEYIDLMPTLKKAIRKLDV